MNKYEEFNNNNNLLKDLNMTIVSYESERIKAQKRGDSEKNLFYERKRQELEEIRDKIAQNELLDEKSILIIKELYDEEKNQNENSKKMSIISTLTTIVVAIIAFIILKDIENAIIIGIGYFFITHLIGKEMVKNRSYNKAKNKSNDENGPIQKN
ncbi:MAG: hypothetical protein J6C46_10510 [Clostridia bacterium]|nr:hypothetical protein [Clostridia bacterium]